MKKKIRILIFFLILIILIILFLILKNVKKETFDDIIFFKLFSQTNSINENSKKNQYIIDFKKDNQIFTKVNLMETVDLKKLVNEKIQPGTNGEFEIILKSNKDIYYKMEFESLNNKPENLKFSIKGQREKYNTLEELTNSLQGNIAKEESKIIHIEWNWEYQNGNSSDIQDTNDGTKLKEYNFLIHAIGNEI